MVNNLVKVSQEKKHIIVKGTGGLRGKDGIPGPVGPQGEPGPQGIGVQNVTLAQNDGLDFTLTDGSHRVTASVRGPQGIQGETGPANELTIGSVTKGDTAQATITGDAPSQTLNLVLPKGDQGIQGETGPANTLSIGTVEKGDDASATITGTSPNQTLNLVLPKGDKGDKGDTGEDAPLPEPSGTASGTYIEIENAGPGMDTLKIDGDTKQDTLSGKNLANISGLVNAATVLNNNNGFKFTKISESSRYSQITNFATPIPANTQVVISYNILAGSTSCFCQWYCSDGTSLWSPNLSTTQTSITASFTKEVTGFRLYFQSGVTDGTYFEVNNFMIRYSTATADFEPYVGGVASPNPDYPQTVQTVTGAQVVEYHTKNLINKNVLAKSTGLTIAQTNTGIKVTKTRTNQYDYVCINVPNSSKYLGNTLTLKMNITSSADAVMPYVRVYWTDNSGTVGTWLANLSVDGSKGVKSVKFNIPASIPDASKPNIGLLLYPDFREQSGTWSQFDDIQLEVGSTATAYEPYQSIKHEINLGKNLFDVTAITENTAASTSGVKDHVVTYSANSSRAVTLIKVEPNTKYTLSIGNTSIVDRLYIVGMENTTQESGHSFGWSANGAILNTSNNDNYILGVISVPSGGGSIANITNAKVQLEKGSTATTFEPYFEPIELCKIGTAQDYIFKDEGGWKVHKAVGKLSNHTMEGWYNTATTSWGTRFYWTDGTGASSPNDVIVKSTHFRGTTYNQRSTDYVETVYCNGNFGVTTAIASTRQDFVNELNSRGVVFYYVLATPTNTVITNQALINQLEALRTAKMIEGNCIIENTSENLAGNLDIKYWTWYKGPQGPQGPSGQGAWGTITGDITTQADLQSELSKFALKTTTVNGQAISSNVTLTANDISGISTAGKDGKYTSLTDRPLEETVLTATLSGTTFSATAASPFVTTAPAVGDRVLVKFDTMVEEGIFKLSINGETPLDCVLTPQTSVSGDMPMFMETVLEGRVYEFIKTQSGDIYQYECLSEHKKVSTFDLNWSSINGGEQSSDIYGTTEQRIGTWINGKPLYRSVLEFTNTARGVTNLTTSLKAPIETLCHGYGSYYDASYGWQPLVNCVPDAIQAFSSSFGNVKVNGSGYVTLTLILGSSRQTTNKIHLVLEYTKTTD